jgi:hypothetical protein
MPAVNSASERVTDISASCFSAMAAGIVAQAAVVAKSMRRNA